jgi:hypothetical protein
MVLSLALLLGVKVAVTLPLESVNPELGDTDALYPDEGYATLENEKTTGTPGWVDPKVKVTV